MVSDQAFPPDWQIVKAAARCTHSFRSWALAARLRQSEWDRACPAHQMKIGEESISQIRRAVESSFDEPSRAGLFGEMIGAGVVGTTGAIVGILSSNSISFCLRKRMEVAGPPVGSGTSVRLLLRPQGACKNEEHRNQVSLWPLTCQGPDTFLRPPS